MPRYLSSLVVRAKKHRKIYSLLTLIFLTLVALPALSNDGSGALSRYDGFKKSKKVAILVGVENYPQSSGFSSLNYAVDDVDLLGRTLKKQEYKVHQLTDTQATKKQIIESINKAAKTLRGADGTLVFSFSGHGLNEGRHNYLATYDSRLNALPSTAISVREVVDEIRKAGVKRAVMFVDACRNDPVRGARSAGHTLIRSYLGGEGIQVLYATGNRKLSLEDSILERGIFTHFVNEGLNEHAILDDGTVDFDSLAAYVMRAVPKYTTKKGYNLQQPWRSSTEYFGDFIVAIDKTHTKDKTPPKETKPTQIDDQVTTNQTHHAQLNAMIKAQREAEIRAQREAVARGVKLIEDARKKRDKEILKQRQAINADHNLKKHALRIECRRKSNGLKSQFQKRRLDYDIALRQRLNTLPSTMNDQQRMQAESRLKSNTRRLKLILTDDNKHRQLVITRECADKGRLLNRQFKLRIQDFERTIQKRRFR